MNRLQEKSRQSIKGWLPYHTKREEHKPELDLRRATSDSHDDERAEHRDEQADVLAGRVLHRRADNDEGYGTARSDGRRPAVPNLLEGRDQRDQREGTVPRVLGDEVVGAEQEDGVADAQGRRCWLLNAGAVKCNGKGVELGPERIVGHAPADKRALRADRRFDEPTVVQVDLMPEPVPWSEDALVPVLIKSHGG